jgi:hypothetical protein
LKFCELEDDCGDRLTLDESLLRLLVS